MGELNTEPNSEPKKRLRRNKRAISGRRRLFVEAYLRTWNASAAAVEAGYSERSKWEIGSKLLQDPAIAEAVRVRVERQVMSADEVLIRLAEQARGDIGQFFKVAERWTQHPLPTEEITKEEQRPALVRGKNTEQTWYLVRSVVLDLDAIKDPARSILIKKLVDSPKSGLALEMYDSQAALTQIGKVFALFKENLDLTSKGDRIVVRLMGEDGD